MVKDTYRSCGTVSQSSVVNNSGRALKWLDIYPVSSTNSQTTIDMLRVSFSNQGLPEMIVSDKAASFTSAQFAEFCDKNGIHHVTSAPYHPASNGLVERAVQSFNVVSSEWEKGV